MNYFWKKVLGAIKFNQKAWLKPYIDMNTDLRKKQEMILKKKILSWWIMQLFGKAMENVIEILKLSQQKEEGTS